MKLSIITLAILLAGLWSSATAGQWHVGESLRCQDCHLQHATQDGEQVPGGPYSTMLLEASVNELCLSCHDGTDPTAPDVQSPVTMYSAGSTGESAAGFFGQVGVDNPHGHGLGFGAVTPLQNQGLFVQLNCAACHAVHGNGNYRNLLIDPAGVGDSLAVVEGVHVFTEFSPANPPTVAGSVAAYDRDNVGYKEGMSTWCASCHDMLAANEQSSTTAHFNGHPSDVALDAYSPYNHTAPGHWTAGLGEGFDLADGGVARVPFDSPGATDYVSSRAAGLSDEVQCLSCHKAHGGAHAGGMLWPYREGGAEYLAGCQQCHNK